MTEFECPGCRTALPLGVDTCTGCGAPIAWSYCGACLAANAPGAATCITCGRSLGPIAPRAMPDHFPCPRCEGPMDRRQLGAYQVHECARCRGAFIDQKTLELLQEGDAPSPGTGAPPESVPPSDPSAPTVLVVDDSDTVRTALRGIFESLGFRAFEAEDGSAGLRAASETAFDLVSTDVMMPNCDGYEFVQALRKVTGYRHTPIVMISSRGERIDKVRGFEAGVDEYLSKPAEPGMIADVVRRLGLMVRGRAEAGPPA